MSNFLSRNAISIVVLASIAAGFLFPEIGLVWNDYVKLLLIFLMFFSSMRIETKDIYNSFKSIPLITFALFMIFIFMPIPAVIGYALFPPIVVAGIILAFSSPSAIATAFWARVFEGDIAFALVISALANILSIITIPVTMLLITGTNVALDPYSMVLTLIELILLPIAVSFLVKRVIHVNWERVTNHFTTIELAILVFLIWGTVAPGKQSAEANPLQFLFLNIFMFISLATGFMVAYLVGRKFNRKTATTIGIATCIKNAALALVIGSAMFDTTILPALIANLVAQNMLIVFLQVFFRKQENAN